MPEVFEFDYAELFEDERFAFLKAFNKDNIKYSDKSIHLNFKNKKTEQFIDIFQTYISKESAAETSFKNIEKVKVNGADAIVGDEGITLEVNHVKYLMYTGFGKAENIKIAQSIK